MLTNIKFLLENLKENEVLNIKIRSESGTTHWTQLDKSILDLLYMHYSKSTIHYLIKLINEMEFESPEDLYEYTLWDEHAKTATFEECRVAYFCNK